MFAGSSVYLQMIITFIFLCDYCTQILGTVDVSCFCTITSQSDTP